MSDFSPCTRERIEQLSLVLWARPESHWHELNGCSGSETLSLPDHDAFPVKPQPMGVGDVDVIYKKGWQLICVICSGVALIYVI